MNNEMIMSSDIYVGCRNGIFLIPNGVSSDAIMISNIQDVHEMTVVEDKAGNISIWATCSPDHLFYIFGRRAPPVDSSSSRYTYQFNQAFLFREGVHHASFVRNRRTLTNQLIIVTNDAQPQLVHYFQDPTTTIWKNQLLRIKNSKYLYEQPSYTTRITFKQATGYTSHHAMLLIDARYGIQQQPT